MFRLKFFLIIFSLLIFSHSGFAQRVYYTPADALKLLFKNSAEVVKDEKNIDTDTKAKLTAILGYELPKQKYVFYVGKTGNKIDGYALIDDQVGKVDPITFISKINPEGAIEQVEIMVYRETHGGDVAQARFLNQFKSKTLNEELRIGRGITNMTGATLSSRALVVGTRRALSLWKFFYGK